MTYLMKDRRRVADTLDRLANGDTVVLGDFSSQADPKASDADVDASLLREVAHYLRGRGARRTFLA